MHWSGITNVMKNETETIKNTSESQFNTEFEWFLVNHTLINPSKQKHYREVK